MALERGLFARGETPVLANGTVEVAYRNGEVEFSPSLPLFVCCMGVQKKQKLRVASQQALFWSFQSALSASLR